MRRRLDESLHFPVSKAFIDLEHTHVNHLTWEGIVHKKDQTICLCHAHAVVAEICDGHTYYVIFLNHINSFYLYSQKG